MPVGPEVAIFDDNNQACAVGDVGQVVVRGMPVFEGYSDAPPCVGFLPGGWFATGDLGCFDQEGMLFIKGRSKVRGCQAYLEREAPRRTVRVAN